jgi:predicted murein hydrolase (TIGR00659 family)
MSGTLFPLLVTGAGDALMVGLTVALFFVAQWIQRKTGLLVLNPILLAVVAIILVLRLVRIPYETYAHGGRYIAFFLKPAIVALGVPLFLQLEKIRKQMIPVLLSQLVACVSGVVSVVAVSVALGASPQVVISLAPKSATTPIAMEVARVTGGIPSLSAIIVILTGILGAIGGLGFLRLIAVKSHIARGLALGAAAHAVGTAHAMQKNPRMGVYSSLGLIINGTLTGVLTPGMLHWLGY